MRLFQREDVDEREKVGEDDEGSRTDSRPSVQLHDDDDESEDKYGVERCFDA